MDGGPSLSGAIHPGVALDQRGGEVRGLVEIVEPDRPEHDQAVAMRLALGIEDGAADLHSGAQVDRDLEVLGGESPQRLGDDRALESTGSDAELDRPGRVPAR